MNRFLLTLTLALACYGTQAQVKFTDEIQTETAGQGKVVLHQSKAITDLVNGIVPKLATVAVKAENRAASSSRHSQVLDSILADSTRLLSQGVRIRINGCRIQVYLGGNTRKGKAEALAMKERVKGYFPELSVYTGFQSPHWICRVGDFRTMEEASEYLHQMRETGRFDEAVIVKSKINVRE